MTENRKIRVLVVDDEPLGREMVSEMLARHSEIADLVGVATTGKEAIAAIENDYPDLVFLDVQMPGGDGFDVLENIKKDKLPAIVFVTAYDEYAIRAFEVNALDYLLKPFDRKRFDKAFERAIRSIQDQTSNLVGEQILSLLSERHSTEKYTERFVIKAGGRVFFLKAEEIAWISSEEIMFCCTLRKSIIFFERRSLILVKI